MSDIIISRTSLACVIITHLGDQVNLVEFMDKNSKLEWLKILRDHHLGMEYSGLENYLLISDIALTTIKEYLS
jgi:hypothetical protein